MSVGNTIAAYTKASCNSGPAWAPGERCLLYILLRTARMVTFLLPCLNALPPVVNHRQHRNRNAHNHKDAAHTRTDLR